MENSEFPLISVVTVTYNAESVLEETILSVVNQTYNYIEYIIIDGGSTDGTLDIIKKYDDKISYWISEPDKGIYDAMNKGLNKAIGAWILFMGSDDVFCNKNSLDICGSFVNDNIYYGDVILKSQNRRYPGKITTAYQLCLTNICHQALFYPRNIYKAFKYNLKYKLWADYVYNLELYSLYPSKFIYLDTVISVFNDKGLGSMNQDLVFINDRVSLIQQFFNRKLSYIMMIRYTLTKIKNGFQNFYSRTIFR